MKNSTAGALLLAAFAAWVLFRATVGSIASKME
jgi:hypothetical protein